MSYPRGLIRNTTFVIIVLRWVNMVEGQSYFWISNTFIWSWILISVIALGELIRREVGENNLRFRIVMKSALIITSIIIVLWILSIPFWNFFFKNIMNIDEAETVFKITIIALVFYIIFAYNNVIDSVFYGLGRTDLILIQSLTINLVFYSIIYSFVLTNIIDISLNVIVIIFGTGILLDSIITLGIYKYTSSKNKLIL